MTVHLLPTRCAQRPDQLGVPVNLVCERSAA
jgi:hypothetical protein